jgi:hypothetical protein
MPEETQVIESTVTEVPVKLNDRYEMSAEDESAFLTALSKDDPNRVPIELTDKVKTETSEEKPAPSEKAAPAEVAADEEDNEPVPTVLKGKAVDEWKKLKNTYKSQLKERDKKLADLQAEIEKRQQTTDSVTPDALKSIQK